ncbi:MAG: hypothetical protein R3242_11835, partial [Akkermansiaceae bacterium]|nr:hypothetical protein [Akkermansiaceae bacterium]
MKRVAIILLCLAGPIRADITAVPDPRSKFDLDLTVVWSPLFKATWDANNRYHGGKPEQPTPDNELMKRLDESALNPDSVFPKGCWKTWA